MSDRPPTVEELASWESLPGLPGFSIAPGRHRGDMPPVETCPACKGAALGCLCPVNEFPARHKGPPPDHA